MRYKTLFRIVCKAMGVYFCILGCAGLLSVATVRLSLTRSPSGSLGWTVAQGALLAARPVFELVIGLYLFYGGRRVADWAVPSNRPYCPECGYDTTGTAGPVCPECGTHRQAG